MIGADVRVIIIIIIIIIVIVYGAEGNLNTQEISF
jgi:hypothetical protein